MLSSSCPWIDIEQDGRKVSTRDESKTSFVEVKATDAWTHDGGHASYLLVCEQR
jgi:hypothetical protein